MGLLYKAHRKPQKSFGCIVCRPVVASISCARSTVIIIFAMSVQSARTSGYAQELTERTPQQKHFVTFNIPTKYI